MENICYYFSQKVFFKTESVCFVHVWKAKCGCRFTQHESWFKYLHFIRFKELHFQLFSDFAKLFLILAKSSTLKDQSLFMDKDTLHQWTPLQKELVVSQTFSYWLTKKEILRKYPLPQ
jgi:hypothetical protein